MKNRIKECQGDLFADSTSSATMRATSGARGSPLKFHSPGVLKIDALVGISVTPHRVRHRFRLSLPTSVPTGSHLAYRHRRSLTNQTAHSPHTSDQHGPIAMHFRASNQPPAPPASRLPPPAPVFGPSGAFPAGAFEKSRIDFLGDKYRVSKDPSAGQTGDRRGSS